jgi:hypothetical protein
MESFSSENRIVYTDLSINAKVFVPTMKKSQTPKTSPKLSVNAKEFFPLTDNSNVKEPLNRFMKNPYKDMK